MIMRPSQRGRRVTSCIYSITVSIHGLSWQLRTLFKPQPIRFVVFKIDSLLCYLQVVRSDSCIQTVALSAWPAKYGGGSALRPESLRRRSIKSQHRQFISASVHGVLSYVEVVTVRHKTPKSQSSVQTETTAFQTSSKSQNIQFFV